MNCSATDPVALTTALIQCPSVTPTEGGALELLAKILEPEGFRCRRIDREGIANLYARAGESGPVLGFAGHTDVVPPGPRELWEVDPFGGEIRDEMIWGRGAVDMKSGVAAFVAAAVQWQRSGSAHGSVALIITGDEEGEAQHGTQALVDWMVEAGEQPDGCVVGEPTGRQRLGDTMKIGRRGSANFGIAAYGHGGHSAYPERARNPIAALAQLTVRLTETRLDEGTDRFAPSTVAVTGFDTGNTAANVIPATAHLLVNVRFNDRHTSVDIGEWIREHMATVTAATDVELELTPGPSAEAFVGESGSLADIVADAVQARCGIEPERSTSGGTSDARFLKNICPTVELGLVSETLHAPNERVPVRDVELLTEVYASTIERFVNAGGGQ